MHTVGLSVYKQSQIRIDFIQKLPVELSLIVFSYLQKKDWSQCRLVSEKWSIIVATIQGLHIKKSVAFGAHQWSQYLGAVADEPSLPVDILKILTTPCPFVKDKMIGDTHLLILIPKSVNGLSLTVNYLEALIKNPRGGFSSRFQYSWDYRDLKKHADTPVESSYWVLLTKDILPNSKNKNYAEHMRQIQVCARKRRIPYQIPRLLELIAGIFSHNMRNIEKNCLYFTLLAHKTYSHCEENDGKFHAIVGAFCRQEGLNIRSDYSCHQNCDFAQVGVAALCRL